MYGFAPFHCGPVVLLCIVAVGALSIIVRTLRNGVAPMPSSARVQSKAISVVRDLGLPRLCTVVELGSGWGNVSLKVSRALPEASVIGYENSPVPFLFSVAARRIVRALNLRFVRANFYRVSLREADLVLCYLSPDAMVRLQPKLAAELKPSALVVSTTFALPSWEASRFVVADDMYQTRIYLYHANTCRRTTDDRAYPV
ncbi:MAG TPA: class I SAM-dependent methyltransferase [Spirochaetia bacterium]|nr:class I SAM-dependent methyltransferase [Spirochaetia bacterium]